MKTMSRLLAPLVSFVALAGVAPAAEAQKEAAVRTPLLADVVAGSSRLDFVPRTGSGAFVVTVSGPEGSVERIDFASGRTIAITATLPDGKSRPDGIYNYELRAKAPAPPAPGPDFSGSESVNGRAVEIENAVRAPEPPAQSGTFRILNGMIVAGSATESRPARSTPAAGATGAGRTPSAGRTALDQVIADDLIVQGSACIGLDCVNNESFGFDTIRLKENNTRIKFDDTSASAGFAFHDWQLTANDNASGGAEKFSIEDITAATVPFTVTGSAPSNALFVDSTGRVGLRTATPVLDLHANTSNTPAMRLEQNSGGGFTAQTWDIAGNEANFFVRDVTGGSRLPFRIRPGAPTSSIDIAASGNVGIGTASPTQKLTVRDGPIFVQAAADNLDVFAGMGVDLSSGPAFNYGYAGSSFGRSAGFFNVRPDASAVAPNPSLRFMTANVQRMIITNTGNVGIGVANPSQPLQMASGAFVSAGGVWTNASSRSLKDDIRDLPADEALETLQGLSPVTYVYKAAPAEPHVGFIAEDVPALLASPDRKGMSPMDVAAVLTKVVQQQQATIAEQNRQLAEQNRLLADLSSRVRVLEDRP
ncbi:MAG TPA: tail fiber domain-containing protein [Thermoanaerobaculia bacterium]|nr:tail fiber domain-containing protein [Thermoanaerobaculia bacterium]